MQTVWVVTEYTDDDALIIGVCATETLAAQLVDKVRRRANTIAVATRYPIITRVEEL